MQHVPDRCCMIKSRARQVRLSRSLSVCSSCGRRDAYSRPHRPSNKAQQTTKIDTVMRKGETGGKGKGVGEGEQKS